MTRFQTLSISRDAVLMPATRTVVLVAAFLFLGTGAMLAQSDQRHQGFWIGFGLGAGWVDDGDPGGTLYVRLGGTLSQRWLLGGETIAWGRRESVDTPAGDIDFNVGRGNTTFSALFYPLADGGLYLKGGVGFSWIKYSTSVENLDITADRGGLGTTLGLGHDIRLGNNIYLVPAFDWLFQAFDEDDGTITSSLFLLSLGLIWH